MGQTNSVEDFRGTLTVNTKLLKKVDEELDMYTSKKGRGKLERLMSKKSSDDFKRSFFTNNFKGADNGNKSIVKLLTAIYSNEINKEVESQNQNSVYTALFNCDLIESPGEIKEQYESNIYAKTMNMINGISENEEFNERDDLSSDLSGVSGNAIRSSKNILKKEATLNGKNKALEKEIMLNENNTLSSNKKKGTLKGTLKSKKSSQDKSSPEKCVNISKLDSSLSGIRNNTPNKNHTQNQSQNQSYMSKKGRTTNKKKKEKEKKAPVVNISLDVKELVKEDAWEKSMMDPKKRFKKVNQGNEADLKLKNNIQKGKFDVSDGPFQETYDLLVQANKKEKDRIHSRKTKNQNENTIFKSKSKDKSKDKNNKTNRNNTPNKINQNRKLKKAK